MSMRLLSATFTLTFLGTLLGCGGGKTDEFDKVLTELEGFKTKMCACTDKACVDKVQDDWRAYRKTMRDKLGKDSKPSEAQDKRGRDLDEEMRACRKKYDADAGNGTGGGTGGGSSAGAATDTPTPTESAGSAAAPATP